MNTKYIAVDGGAVVCGRALLGRVLTKRGTLISAVAGIVGLMSGTAAMGALGTWAGAAGATWNTSATNFTGVTGTPWDSTFGVTNTALFSVNPTPVISGNVFANAVTFTATGSLSSGTLTLAGTSPAINIAPTFTSTISSAIAGTTWAKINTGILRLTNPASTFSGTLTINAGSVQAASIADGGVNSSIGAGSTISFTGNGAQFGYSNTVNGSTNRAIVAGISSQLFNYSTGTATYSGTFTLNGATTTFQLRPQVVAGPLIVSGPINGVGGVLTNGVASSNVFLTNPNSSFTGLFTANNANTFISSVSDAGTNSAIGAGSSIAITGTGTSVFYSSSASGSTNRTITFTTNNAALGNAGTGTFTVTGNVVTPASNATNQLRGTGPMVISGLISGGGGIWRVNGAGTTFLTNPSNSFTGAAQVGFGTLDFNSIADIGQPSALGAGDTIILNQLGGTVVFRWSGTTPSSTNRNLFVTNSNISTNSSAMLTFNGPITANTVMQFRGHGTGGITVNSQITDNGMTLFSKIDSSTLFMTNADNSFSAPANAGDGILDTTSIADSGQNSAIGAGSRITFGSNPGNSVTFTGTLRYSGAGDASTNRELLIGNGVTLDAGAGGIVSNATPGTTLTLNGPLSASNSAVGSNFTVSGAGNGVFAGGITGSPNMDFGKTGAGTWTVTGVNTNTGSNAVSGGTLVVGDGATAGSLGSGSIVNTATLQYSRSDAVAVPNDISGTGAFVQAGTGTVTLSGNLTYSGNTTVSGNGGRLAASSPLRPGTGSLVVSGPGASASLEAPASASSYTHAGVFAGVTVSASGASVSLPVDPARTTNKARVLITGGLSLTGGGTLDLGNADLIVHNTPAASVISLFTGGQLQASAASVATYTGLAIVSNDAGGGVPYYNSYNGTSVQAGDTIAKFAYLGDTDLNGVVDGADIAQVIEGFSTGQSGWAWGDYDYSGTVTSIEVTKILEAYGALAGASLGNGQGDEQSGGAIPEPSALGLLIAAVPMMSRRRR